jgi:hypothetical protein
MSCDFEKIYHCRKAVSQEIRCGNCVAFIFEKTEKLVCLASQKPRFEPRNIEMGECINAKNYDSPITKTINEMVCDLHNKLLENKKEGLEYGKDRP